LVWLKMSDNAATHPALMRAGAGGDDRQVNEVAGFVVRCALMSAQYLTDYFVDDAVTHMFGGAHRDRLCAAAERAGLWRPAEVDGHPGWILLEDSEHLFHIRLRDEVLWERQQQRDTRNTDLTVPVRLRDGDACRYCWRVVNWRDGRSGRGGTLDHIGPGKEATSPDHLVVACRACNAGRRDRDDANSRYPLRPAPPQPYYGPHTAALLAKHGHQVHPGPPVTPGTVLTDGAAPRPRPSTQLATAPSAPQRPALAEPAPGGPPRPRPGNQPRTAPSAPQRPALTEPAPGAHARSSDPAPSRGTRPPHTPAEAVSTRAPRDPARRRRPRNDGQPHNSGPNTDPAGRPRVNPRSTAESLTGRPRSPGTGSGRDGSRSVGAVPTPPPARRPRRGGRRRGRGGEPQPPPTSNPHPGDTHA